MKVIDQASTTLKGLELNTYVYIGHSVLMGKKKAEWQDVHRVLGMFSIEGSRVPYSDIVDKIYKDINKRFGSNIETPE